MKRTLLSFFIVLMVGFSGYPALRAGQEVGKPVTITPLAPKRSGPRQAFTDFSSIGEPLQVVIRDADAWRDLWKRIYGPDHGYGAGAKELPPLPEIDFSRDMIVVAALGGRGSSGYTIIVDGAYEQDDRLEIIVRTISPGKGCMNLTVVTAPADIVRLPKINRSVLFREIKAVHDCNQ